MAHQSLRSRRPDRRMTGSNQIRGIEDQDDSPIAQLSRAGDARHLDHRIGYRSHHDLTLTQNAIYGDADRTRCAADHEYMESIAGDRFQVEEAPEAKQRQDASTMRNNLIVLKRLH